MDRASTRFALFFRDGEHLAGNFILGEENAALLEELSDGCVAVPRAIIVALEVLSGWALAILSREVASREYMGRSKRVRGFDTVKQEDLVSG